MRKIYLFSIFLLCFVLSLSGQKVIKVACVGNSITAGFGLQHPETDSYPIVLGQLLGTGYEVRNFGVSGATMLKKGDYPYMMRTAYQEALQYEPDIVTIKLGTNDSKPQNWKFKKYFEKDMKTMIKSFLRLKSHPRIYLCYPATAYALQWGINNQIIEEEIIPLIDKMAAKYKLKVIDSHRATADMPEHFKDHIHPDVVASKAIAEIICKELTATADAAH